MTDLRELQQWFVQVLRSPVGQEQLIEQRVVAGGNGMSAMDRVAIYGSSYYARLVQVMETEFPVLQQTLGEELFSQFALSYISHYPPQDYTLNKLGEYFPEFLYRSKPQEDDQWSSFIVELAHLERLINEVYHGEGPERGEYVPSTEIEAILSEPWTKTMQCSFQLHRYYLDVRKAISTGEDVSEVGLPAATPCRVAIFRRDYKVKLRAF
ncbi:Putative DNA-binding domain-containing protein [Rubritalea squalenifaciens DSM 18772]|uniref:Putative DNA-binding domain-containing protein n=1 Tax=Rubritalea squalenifaciens DSM 18772 TaxID=1123071 RepID=A0A1M6JI72_9BACT|nr:DNA-binding domain-containing protein [Rubritalea squalenifaciens]SHJ46384.1 Putative DNA-binding domain-containing protein [Rubritalea squalenifaciens DSM 18772]